MRLTTAPRVRPLGLLSAAAAGDKPARQDLPGIEKAKRMFADLEDAADQADGDLSLSPKPKLTKRQVNRLKALLPGGTPRYVRCYDNGGETCDRYTVVFHGQAGGRNYFPYLAMNAAPFDPQGFGQHGESGPRPCDADKWGFPPALGRTCHLGKRIPFAELPPDCRKLALQDYREIWNLKGGAL